MHPRRRPNMTMDDVLKKLEHGAKTLSVPEAGEVYFGLKRNAAYEAAKRGQIPTIKLGKMLRVPVVALERMLNEARPVVPQLRDDDQELLSAVRGGGDGRR